MDGLTAVGLAANIIQFLDFCATLLSEASEVYHSASGLSQEYVELQDVARDLSLLVDGLITPKTNAGPRVSYQGLGPGPDMLSIAHSAKAVATELISVTRGASGC
ncbi:hypothetical protein BU26DRAFT_517483 [Trematosphaeria pertusa]|uniref:Uncharacterized protein n=1 Tax=Trematosphaeria pertusa TaxID=390896 RepID=A0A6A6IJB1_9PLEO|nr:uncharacterized protein BU26DRAFT_517483 [Trematosphaeria pertusa]KAF2250664.1 hypothetical protein BU26DRAFT_517483 [Trematosphaeria pertusa]